MRLVFDTGWLLRGRVVSGNSAVADAWLVAGDRRCRSEANGRFVLYDLDPALARVSVKIRIDQKDVGMFVAERPQGSLQQEAGDVAVGSWSDGGR